MVKYIEILEDVEHYKVSKGDIFQIKKDPNDDGKSGFITPTIAGALVNANRARFLNQEVIAKMVALDVTNPDLIKKSTKVTVEINEGDIPEIPESPELDSNINEEGK